MSVNSGLISNTNVETNSLRRATIATSGQVQAPFADVLEEQEQAVGNAPKISPELAKQLAGPLGMVMDKVAPENKEMAARANIVAQADFDKQRMQALEQMGMQISSGGTLLDMARNDGAVRNLRTVIGSFSMNGVSGAPLSGSIKAHALAHTHRGGRLEGISRNMPERSVTPRTASADKSGGIGSLASQFESGSAGISAIGYDRVGGTSYGKYQIASRVGSMDNFLNFLDTAAPDMAKRLRDAGPSNTGSRSGEMPDVWRTLAAEEPERFGALQEQFIYDSHYAPALQAITNKTPIDEDQLSPAMQEVLWSTAVQHGPTGAARIFGRAVNNIDGIDTGKTAPQGKDFEKALINNVYAIRAEQFGSSTQAVQDSVRNRMHKEKSIALSMLGDDTTA